MCCVRLNPRIAQGKQGRLTAQPQWNCAVLGTKASNLVIVSPLLLPFFFSALPPAIPHAAPHWLQPGSLWSKPTPYPLPYLVLRLLGTRLVSSPFATAAWEDVAEMAEDDPTPSQLSQTTSSMEQQRRIALIQDCPHHASRRDSQVGKGGRDGVMLPTGFL